MNISSCLKEQNMFLSDQCQQCSGLSIPVPVRLKPSSQAICNLHSLQWRRHEKAQSCQGEQPFPFCPACDNLECWPHFWTPNMGRLGWIWLIHLVKLLCLCGTCKNRSYLWHLNRRYKWEKLKISFATNSTFHLWQTQKCTGVCWHTYSLSSPSLS